MKNLDDIIANAQSLMLNEDFWSKVDDVEMSRSTNGKKSKGSGLEIFKNNLNDVVRLKETAAPKREKTGNPVLDSFIDKPPMTGINNPYQLNELNAIGSTQTNQQENRSYQSNTYTQTQNTTSIDYNYIKYIVEEAVKNAMSNNVINESTGSNIIGMKMSEGNKINFIDKKGNIYEGVLKLKKKAPNK